MDPVLIPLVGEPLALDLVNTRFQPPTGPELDVLAAPETFQAWLAEQGDRLDAAASAVDLAAVRALRDHVSRAVHEARHGRKPPERSLRALTAAQRGAPAYRRLGWDGIGVTATWRRHTDPTTAFLAELAEAAADLLTVPSIRNVRQCAGPACRLLFLPAHPRRQWCSPALCGNRVRVARYYERHRGRTG